MTFKFQLGKFSVQRLISEKSLQSCLYRKTPTLVNYMNFLSSISFPEVLLNSHLVHIYYELFFSGLRAQAILKRSVVFILNSNSNHEYN